MYEKSYTTGEVGLHLRRLGRNVIGYSIVIYSTSNRLSTNSSIQTSYNQSGYLLVTSQFLSLGMCYPSVPIYR